MSLCDELNILSFYMISFLIQLTDYRIYYLFCTSLCSAKQPENEIIPTRVRHITSCPIIKCKCSAPGHLNVFVQRYLP